MTNPITPAQLHEAIITAGLPAPHPTFLSTLLSSNSQRQPPLSSLSATARIRLLASDFTLPNTLSPANSSLPPNITDVHTKERVLLQDTPVQVLDVEDVGRSKWEQIEALESERRGERVKGREVIRVVPQAQEGDFLGGGGGAYSSSSSSSTSTQALLPTPAATILNPGPGPGPGSGASNGLEGKGPFKVLLQDMKGQKVYGFELKRVEKVGYPPGMSIGCKVMLKKGCRVARGMVLLEPGAAVVLGGKIEGLDKAWREGREERLREQVKRDGEGAARG